MRRLLDRTGKKLLAIERILLAANLPPVDCIALDARQAASRKELKHRFDLITVRAVASPEEIGPIAARMLTGAGHLLHRLPGVVGKRGLCHLAGDPVAVVTPGEGHLGDQ